MSAPSLTSPPRPQPEDEPEPARRGGRRIAFVLISAIILYLLVGHILMPTHVEYRQRALIAEGLTAARELAKTVDARLLAGTAPEKAGAGLTLLRNPPVKGGTIAENGSIYVVLEDPPAVITLRIEAFDTTTRKATWKCAGWPAKLMPLSCRES